MRDGARPSPTARNSGVSRLALQVVHRPAVKGRETRGENESCVGEIGVGDNPFGDYRLRFLQVGRDEFLGELGRGATRRALAYPAVPPHVESAAGLLAEVARRDKLGELLRRVGALARPIPGHPAADVPAHRVRPLDRSPLPNAYR